MDDGCVWAHAELASNAADLVAPNNSLQLTRLASGRLERDLAARMRENEWAVA
jgi:hypothetical protein